MLALLSKAAIIAAIVFVFALIGLAIWQRSLPAPQEIQQQHITQEGEADKKKTKSNNKGVFDSFIAGFVRFVRLLDAHNGLVNAIGTLVVALFTGVLFIATVALFISSEKVAESAKTSAEAAQKSAGVSEKALLVLERAYVALVGVELKPAIPERPLPHIRFGFANVGRTPASIVGFGGQIKLSKLDPAGTDGERTSWQPYAIALPQNEKHLGINFWAEIFRDKELAEVKSGLTKLDFTANVVFDDIFGNRYSKIYSFTFDREHDALFMVPTPSGTAEQK
jgi:hypothetical protein